MNESSQDFEIGCDICGNKATEANGKCGTCNARIRKFERDSKNLEAKNQKKSSYKIPKVSEKLKAALVDYKKLRLEHLKKRPDCQMKLIGCQNDRKTNTVHHVSGRGKNLNNSSAFMTVCIPCHYQIHNVLSAEIKRKLGALITPK